MAETQSLPARCEAGAHTAGPWSIDHDYVRQIDIIGHPAWPCVRYGQEGQWTVATVEVLDDHPDETLANARLIAAAPDLLEALAMLLGVVDRMDRPASAGGGVLPMDKAAATRLSRAAIARATGQSEATHG